MNAGTYNPEPHVSQRSLWFGFFAACFAFALEGFTGWVISSRACFIGEGSLGPISPGGVRWLLAGITIVLFAVAVTAGTVSYRNWRSLSASKLTQTEGKGAREFVALSGVLISSILSIGILWAGLSLIFLNECMREH